MYPTLTGLGLEIIKHSHDVSHLGIDKVFNSCARQAFRPKMYEQIFEYVKWCQQCQVNKKPNAAPSGELYGLPVPKNCWDVVTTDFLTDLPTSTNGQDAIVIIVDKHSKRAILAALKNSASARDVAQIFRDRLFTKHGSL